MPPQRSVPQGRLKRRKGSPVTDTYTSLLLHVVFSTKERRNTIPPLAQPRLREFIGGIGRKHGLVVRRVGGTANHLHMLLSLPPTIAPAKAVQLIKGGSSKFMHETFPEADLFAWQKGYSAFSVSASHVERTLAYVDRQEEHHKTRTFEGELRAILEKHGIEWDERRALD